MVELKCRAETAVTGRSACRNEECEHSKEKGGRIPQGKLRWGIGGPGGHSMKWYCIRPRCLPADQVKDMLVPEKHESAAVMEGVSDLPDGMREATIMCLEYIRDDKADQLDEATLAKLDEVGPLVPIVPRAAPRIAPESPPPIGGGRQGLRRARRSIGASMQGGNTNEDSDEAEESGDDGNSDLGRTGLGTGGSSPPARTVNPPALLIPRHTASGQGGGDSPLLSPQPKIPKLIDESGGAAGAGGSYSGLYSESSSPIVGATSLALADIDATGSTDVGGVQDHSEQGLGIADYVSPLGHASTVEAPVALPASLPSTPPLLHTAGIATSPAEEQQVSRQASRYAPATTPAGATKEATESPLRTPDTSAGATAASPLVGHVSTDAVSSTLDGIAAADDLTSAPSSAVPRAAVEFGDVLDSGDDANGDGHERHADVAPFDHNNAGVGEAGAGGAIDLSETYAEVPFGTDSAPPSGTAPSGDQPAEVGESAGVSDDPGASAPPSAPSP